MAYSVLHTGKDNDCMIWCSKRQSAILHGPEKEMYDFKEFLERGEQVASDDKHFASLKNKYIDLLVAGGHSRKEANEFLVKEMPFLYESA